MKTLKDLKDIKVLSKKEQKTISGGIIIYCRVESDCPSLYCCLNRACVYGC